MTDTLVANGDGDDAEKPEQVDGGGMMKAFARWAENFKAELDKVETASTQRHGAAGVDAEAAYFVQPFEGDVDNLDDESIGDRLWRSAWDRAQALASESGKRNIASLSLEAVGRSEFDGVWMNAATWAYVRW